MRTDLPDDLLAAEPRDRLQPWIAGVLLLVAIGGAVDLASDAPESWLSAHVLFEGALMATSLGFAAWLWRGWWRASRSLADTRRSLLARESALQAERDAWRERAQGAIAGFSAALEQQFDAWGLTPTEREVALLLLQGHGHKQIAGRTGRSERTVRQHAVALYQKAGLGGRAELAAFFLEGLLLPTPAATDAPAADAASSAPAPAAAAARR